MKMCQKKKCVILIFPLFEHTITGHCIFNEPKKCIGISIEIYKKKKYMQTFITTYEQEIWDKTY